MHMFTKVYIVHIEFHLKEALHNSPLFQALPPPPPYPSTAVAQQANKPMEESSLVPTSLPTLLFCRITELTIFLEGSNPVTYELWEEMVQERSQLMDVSNDIKMIGKGS